MSVYMGKLRVVVLDENGGYAHDFDASYVMSLLPLLRALMHLSLE